MAASRLPDIIIIITSQQEWSAVLSQKPKVAEWVCNLSICCLEIQVD